VRESVNVTVQFVFPSPTHNRALSRSDMDEEDDDGARPLPLDAAPAATPRGPTTPRGLNPALLKLDLSGLGGGGGGGGGSGSSPGLGLGLGLGLAGLPPAQQSQKDPGPRAPAPSSSSSLSSSAAPKRETTPTDNTTQVCAPP